MKKNPILLLSLMVLNMLPVVCFAGINPITISYNGGTTSFTTAGTGTARYIVNLNQAVTPANATLSLHLSTSGASTGLVAQQITTGTGTCSGGITNLCGQSFSLRAGESCCLSFSLSSTIAGTFSLKPKVSTSPPTYSAEAPSALTISVGTPPTTPVLHVSQNAIALSISGTTSTGQIIGAARHFNLTNTSEVPITGLTISEPTLPVGTTQSTTCGATLLPGASCTVTITPGVNATSNCTTGIEPTPGVITISADEITPIEVEVLILGYGCIYQEGFIFSIDDSTPTIGSIGGTVAALENQANAVIWSSNGTAGTRSYDMIPGIGNTSTSSSGTPTFADLEAYFNVHYFGALGLTAGDFNQCNGKMDGQCNTSNIVTFYNYYQTNFIDELTQATPTVAPTTLSYYAAGICDSYDSGSYQDWYLPTICELTYDAGGGYTPGCGDVTSQLMQNVAQNLFGIGPAGFASTFALWSSTEFMIFNPEIHAWNVLVSHKFPGGGDKNDTISVRCVRSITF